MEFGGEVGAAEEPETDFLGEEGKLRISRALRKMSDSGSDAGPGGEGEWDDWNEEFMAVTKSVVHASRARRLETMPWRNAHLFLITTARIADQVAELKERRSADAAPPLPQGYPGPRKVTRLPRRMPGALRERVGLQIALWSFVRRSAFWWDACFFRAL